jgi:epsilon-lactone hydrolase
MRKTAKQLTLTLIALLVLGQTAHESIAEEMFRPLIVPERTIPVPLTVSPQLQKMISGPVATAPVPGTNEEWRALREVLDTDAAAAATELADQRGMTVSLSEHAGVPVRLVTPARTAPDNADRLLVHLHGGAYVFSGGDASILEAVLIADACQAEVISVDYRMPPDHPFPAAIDDASAVWLDLIETRGADETALFGTSAGGGLAAATILALKEKGAVLPKAVFMGTPWSDLSRTGDSYFTNDGVDRVLGSYDGLLKQAARLYADTNDLKAPLVSPVYGDVTGFPPTLLVSGTRDLFLSNTIRFHRALRDAGTLAELHIFEGQSHGDYLDPGTPESVQVFREVCAYFDAQLSSEDHQ